MVDEGLIKLCSGLPTDQLPQRILKLDENVSHAPSRNPKLSKRDKKLALMNALRYFPSKWHSELANDFAKELEDYGHIYMYRFLPELKMMAYPIDFFPCYSKHAAAIMVMILNNLDHRVAQFPHELVTYGGNGQVFNNWAQFWITLNYLSIMNDHQTLVLYSGHPMGLFPSNKRAPRLIITNGMVIPNYSSREDYERLFSLGVTMFGQMTAGSFCYIGPQGIVHGTTLTILNAGRRYSKTDNLLGKVFVTSGLGGMSGAQAKAAVIAGCIGVIAEINEEVLNKRFNQGWLMEREYDLESLVARIRRARKEKLPVSIGYLGNIVDLLERLVLEVEKTGDLLVDLASDQTSLHNPFLGGYFPVQLTFEASLKLMHKHQEKFQHLVQQSLVRHVEAINVLAEKGMFFWDYGNSFLLEAHRAGASVLKKDALAINDFKYPSYVQHIMGDIFSLGFGPFRWVCTSGKVSDLQKTDQIATKVLESIIAENNSSSDVIQQYEDNLIWIRKAEHHDLVVGSQARILYSDKCGRVKIALAFNEAIADKQIEGPIVISRDHHDVSGTDSPFRETSNIEDGSALCADMAVQNAIGDSFRGASWVALHNGGGIGWGEVINGGFGLVLDGSSEAAERAEEMLSWDVNNGVARRSWAGNDKAIATIKNAMSKDPDLKVTLPNKASSEIQQQINQLIR